MNRTDRLLAIVLELQVKGNVRAEDLAHTFEVSKRTIYRDITALSEAKVPIVASPGTGYRLMEGYFLPPLSFTPDEAAMLVAGVQAVRFTVDDSLRDAAKAALRKLDAVLTPASRGRVQELTASMRIFGGGAAPAVAEKLSALRDAILDRRVVDMRYHSPRYSEPESRSVEPYNLAFYRGVWHLSGYCRLRHDVREFRLDRIDELHVSDETFTREARDTSSPQHRRRGSLTVRVRFDPAILRWVQEERHWSQVAEETEGVLVFALDRAEDLIPWLLRWGARARVLEPPSMRAALVALLEEIANMYSPLPVSLP